MFTKGLVIFFCLLASLLSVVAVANEGGHEATPESGGKKTHADTQPGKDSPLPPWVDLEGKIAELSAKIKNKELNIEKLLKEKKELANDSPQVKPLIQEIVKEHKELQKYIQDYEKKRSTLKYRYPERGSKVERVYKKIESKSLDDVEAAVGVDGKLNRNIHRMRSQYGSDKNAEHGKALPGDAAIPKKDGGTIEDEGSVILRK